MTQQSNSCALNLKAIYSRSDWKVPFSEMKHLPGEDPSYYRIARRHNCKISTTVKRKRGLLLLETIRKHVNNLSKSSSHLHNSHLHNVACLRTGMGSPLLSPSLFLWLRQTSASAVDIYSCNKRLRNVFFLNTSWPWLLLLKLLDWNYEVLNNIYILTLLAFQ